MDKTEHDLLIRVDERLKYLVEKVDTHVEQSEQRNKEVKADIKELNKKINAINRWRYGVIGSWVVAGGAYIKDLLGS